MKTHPLVIASALLLSSIGVRAEIVYQDPATATWNGCKQPKGPYSTTRQDGFVPGLYAVTANLPGALWKRDGSLARRKIVCSHEDSRTSGASIIIPWAQFDKRNGQGGGFFDWSFVEEQIKPWADRGQVVNILIWPAVQKRSQLFPEGQSATPEYIMNLRDMTYQCPDSRGAQGDGSQGIPLPKFWKPEVYLKYAQALKTFVRQYENDDRVSYFRFGIGVGAESYPANGATTHNNYCMKTFVNQFGGDSYVSKAETAYDTWTDFAVKRARAFRSWNSTKPIVVTVNSFSTLSTIPKNDFPRMMANEATRDLSSSSGDAYPKLGLGVQGATTYHAEQWAKGEECYADWCGIFEEAKHHGIPLQLQTPLHSGVNGRPGPLQNATQCQTPRQNNATYGCTNTGNMKEMIEFGLERGVNSFELYSYEWMVANDKGWSNNPPWLNWNAIYGEQYNEALEMASNEKLVRV